MNHRFIQIHALTTYPASLLNRDDAGFAKRIPFGGQVRTRISSQCLKRHWRTFDGPGGLGDIEAPRSVRSRHTFEKMVVGPLLDEGMDEEAVRSNTAKVMKALKLGEPDKKKDTAQTGQITVLGRPEVDHLRGLVRQAVAGDVSIDDLLKSERANLKALTTGAGLEAALFGRMVTSDLLARCDAAIHVAHAFTVHAHQGETDYFSAVDDLPNAEEDGAGAGHIGNTELASGLYYLYVVVDVPLLLSNLTGGEGEAVSPEAPALAAAALAALLRSIATVSPGAKKGSTAPYAYAQTLLLEGGDTQPRSLANAFFRPVSPRGDILRNAYDQIGAFLADHDQMYGRHESRVLAGLKLPEGFAAQVGAEGPSTLDGLAETIASWVSA